MAFESGEASLLTMLPKDLRNQMLAYVGRKTLRPLLVRSGYLEYQIVRKGSACEITQNLLDYDADGEVIERSPVEGSFCLENEDDVVEYLLYETIKRHNSLLANDRDECEVHIEFLGMESLGNCVKQSWEIPHLNLDVPDGEAEDHYAVTFKKEFRDNLRHSLRFLGKVFVFDQ